MFGMLGVYSPKQGKGDYEGWLGIGAGSKYTPDPKEPPQLVPLPSSPHSLSVYTLCEDPMANFGSVEIVTNSQRVEFHLIFLFLRG